MASANMYAGKFIGNDILPTPRQIEKVYEQVTEPAVIRPPVAEMVQSSQASAMAATAIPRAWPGSRFLNLRSSGLLLALFMSVYLGLLTVTDITHSTALASINTAIYNLQQRVSDNIHHVPTYVPLAPYTVAVKSDSLSSDLKNIASQSVAITFSFATINPTSSQVAQWVSTSAGPKTGTTLIAANLGAIESYLNSQVKTYDRSPTNEVVGVNASGTSQVITNGTNGIAYGGVDNVAKQIAGKLLTASGATVSMQSTSIPYKTTNSTTP